MASKRIEGITIEIGSDLSGLNKAIKQANKEINSLQRELKGVDSLLKLDPGNVELLAQKEKLLTDAIDGTEKKLKELKAAKEAADQTMAAGGEVNEEQYRNLQREIVSTEQKLKSLEQEQKEFGSVAKQQLEVTAKKYEDLGNKVEGVGKKLTPLSGAAAGALAGMGGLAVKAGQTADEINTLSKVTGISTEELQKFKYGADLVDVSTEDIAKSVQKLKKSMSSASSDTGATAEAFAKLGVNVKAQDGSLRDSTQVFYEAIDALGKMENETERDALAMQIFGKSAANLNPLIEAGSDAFATAAANAHIMSQEQLDAANEFNDVIDQTKATVGSALMALGATIGQTLMPMLQSLAGWLTDLADKIANMNPTILKIIMVISAVVAAAAPVLIIVGKLISSIGVILRLIPALRAGIVAVNTVLAANPIGLVIAGIAALVAAIVYLYNNNEEFRVKVQAIFEKLKAAFNVVVDVVKKGIEKVKGFVTAVRDTVVNVYNKVVEIINSIKEKIAGIVTAVSDMRQKIIEKIQGFVNIGTDIVKGLWQGIKNAKDWILGKIKDWCGSILNGFKNFFGIHSPSVVMRDQVGAMLMTGLAIGMKNSAGEVMKTATDICNELITRMDKVLSGWSIRDTLQESQYKLWEMTEGKYLGEDEKLKEKLKFLRQELGEQGDTINLMLQKWTQLKKQYGINSQEAMTYQNQIVQEKIKMQELQNSIEEAEKALENFGKEAEEIIDFGDLDFSDAVYDFGDAANYAVSASYQQSDELLDKIATATAEYIGQALLSGLVGIQDTILAAMPAKLQLNLNGREVAETTWTDFDAVGDRKSRLFAPSRQTIANIAASVVNTYAGA